MNLFLLEDGRLRAGWRFVISVLAIILMNVVAGNVSVAIAGGRSLVLDLLYRSLTMVLLLIAFLAMTSLFDRPEGSYLVYNGLPVRDFIRQSLSGALLGFGMVFLAVIIIAIFFQYRITQMVLNPHTAKLALSIGFVILTGAMAEELMFRGYPFQRLVEGMGQVGAILVLSALFGAVHLQNPHISDSRAVQVFAFCNTLLIGVVLAFAYLHTKALWLPWGIHFGWNAALGLVFGLPVSGINEFAVLVKAKAMGPEWMLGGGYGIEGGFLGTLMILLAMVYVLVFVKTAPERVSQVDEPASSSIQPNGTI